MGLYDDQIKTRIKNDRDGFDESFFRLASVVTGETKDVNKFLSNREKAKNAIEEILKHFNILPTTLPDEIVSVDDQLEFLLRPSGVMRRKVELKGKWYKDGYGPLLGSTKNGEVIALLPGKFSGYVYLDRNTGKTIKVTKSAAEQIETDAYCFYKPLPIQKLKSYDLIKFVGSSLSGSDFAVLGALALVTSLLGMVMPYGTYLLLNNVAVSGKILQLLAVAVLLFGAALSSALITIASEVMVARIDSKIDISVQSAVMSRILSLPVSFFKNYSAGNLAQRLYNLNQKSSTIIGIISKTAFASIFSLLYIGQIAAFAPALAIPALIIIAVGLLFTFISALATAKAARLEMDEQSKVAGFEFALFSGIQKIRLAGCEQRAFAKWAAYYEKFARRLFTPPYLVRLSPVISLAITAIGAVALFYVAGRHNISAANYIAFSASYGIVSAAQAMLATITLTFASAKPVLDMTKPILETEPEIAAGKKVISKLSGSIEINNVSFRYNEDMPLILDNVSLKIRSGQYIAIVGPSGCGKSTLLRLLLGFEKPSKGAIYYDAKDINSIDLKSLRRLIGCVIQNGKLMSGDIFSNIAVSAPHLTLDEAWKAAEMADVADDIRAMPMGMHTIISEGGGGISGGQRQRLLIARAIASNPKILMLDEATSALDNLTQKHVSDSLNVLKCTRIVIAHRLSTILQCDRIIFLDKGKIVEDGAYNELIALKGKFAELVERQQLDLEGFSV